MRIFAEQIRGPVLRVTPFDTDDEAVSVANAVTNPTAAYLWTSDLERARRLAPALETPGLWVNAHNHQDRPGDIDIDFYTRSLTVRIAADDTPVPRFGG